MKAYEAGVRIDTAPEQVWKILVDGGGYTEWDSGVKRFEGTIGPGERLKIVPEMNPGRTFPVRVTEFDVARSMRWSGGMPLGLFKGERTFTLTPAGEAATDFRVREEYTGPLLPLIWRSMPDLGPAFERFVRGLKQRAEGDG